MYELNPTSTDNYMGSKDGYFPELKEFKNSVCYAKLKEYTGFGGLLFYYILFIQPGQPHKQDKFSNFCVFVFVFLFFYCYYLSILS